MSHAKPNKTKDRILHISLQLFNERGERSVTTNHIAAELGISPGNLYYHFRNKQEIIKELAQQYQAETLEMLALPTDRPLNANDKISYFQVLSNLLWAYRFIHRDVYHLVDSCVFRIYLCSEFCYNCNNCRKQKTKLVTMPNLLCQ